MSSKYDRYRSPNYQDKAEVKLWYQNNPEAYARAAGVLQYLLTHYDTETGFHGYINKKNKVEYRFNSISETPITCVVRKQWVLVRFNVNNLKVLGEFPIKTLQGRRKKKEEEIGKNKVIDFEIRKETDLKELDRFLSINRISNMLYNEGYWNNTVFTKLPDSISVTVSTPSGTPVTIHGYEAYLARQFANWLERTQSVNNIQFETPTTTQNVYDRLDATFHMSNIGNVIAELKSVRSGRTSTKMCIRNALGQLLDYRHYGIGNVSDQMWIVIDSKPKEMDIQFVTQIAKTYNMPIKVVYQSEEDFIVVDKEIK